MRQAPEKYATDEEMMQLEQHASGCFRQAREILRGLLDEMAEEVTAPDALAALPLAELIELPREGVDHE